MSSESDRPAETERAAVADRAEDADPSGAGTDKPADAGKPEDADPSAARTDKPADAEAIDVRDAPERGRYELTLDGRLAGVAFYSRGTAEITLKHTEIDAQFEGRGLGSRLARHVLDEARAQELRVVPHCPFMAGYIRTHPEYRDLVEDPAEPTSAP